MTSAPADHATPPTGSDTGRPRASLVRRLLAVLLWIVATLAGLVAGLIVFVLTAQVVAFPIVFAAAAVAACFLAVVALGWPAHRVARSGRRLLRVSAVITAVVAVVAGAVLFWPLTRDSSTPQAAAGVRYWDLDTGSRLAYWKYSATTAQPTRTPLVFLHGGPGGPLRPFEYDFFPQFTRDGYDVYLFEQAGVGASRALPHAADYTAARAVADLEAVRQKIGSEQMVLVGQSWEARWPPSTPPRTRSTSRSSSSRSPERCPARPPVLRPRRPVRLPRSRPRALAPRCLRPAS